MRGSWLRITTTTRRILSLDCRIRSVTGSDRHLFGVWDDGMGVGSSTGFLSEKAALVHWQLLGTIEQQISSLEKPPRRLRPSEAPWADEILELLPCWSVWIGEHSGALNDRTL